MAIKVIARLCGSVVASLADLKTFAFSFSFAASYAVSVRRASVLPAASSEFHLAMDTLAVQLTIPPAGVVRDFHPQVNAPCRAHNRKADQPHSGRLFCSWRRFRSAYCSGSAIDNRCELSQLSASLTSASIGLPVIVFSAS